MHWLRFGVLVMIATLLQTSLIGVIHFWRPEIKPDLLLILLVFFAIYSSPRDAVITSFAIGFAADLSSPVRGLMGPQIVSFGVLGTLLSDVHNVVSIRRIPHQAIAILIIGAMTALLSHLLTFFRTEPAAGHLLARLLWQPLYSGIIGPILFWPIAWWMRMNRKGRVHRVGMGRRRLR